MILTGIGDDIYSTFDAYTAAKDMWIAIERFYKMMNEMVRNQLEVATMQVNVQFIQQLQPKWSRFVTIVKQTVNLDKESYHNLFDILKQQVKKGVPLRVEQSDWLDDTDEEIDEQELETHYSFMAKIQEVITVESGYEAEPLEKGNSNVIPNSSDMCNNDNQANQNDEECDDERVVLANLIANLKLDADENKKIQNLEESNRTRDRYLVALHDQEVELA
ncbi:hypothetical protein Tco_0531804 [Tanacetum coccineum]